MANEFNPQLSKAREQQSGVVDQAAGMGYEIGAGLIQTGKQEFGKYQVRNLNEEINEINSKEYTVSDDEAKTLGKFNDEIGIELMKEEQGITNQQQKTLNINKAAAEAKKLAPWMSDEIDKTVAKQLNLTGGSTRAAGSALDLKSAAGEAKKNLMKQRESISLQFFGVSSTKLNDNQYKKLREYERAQAANKMEEVALKTEQLAFDRNELDDKKAAEQDEDNKLRINRISDTTLSSLNDIMIESLNVDSLTLNQYNEGIALYKMQGNQLVNRITKQYTDAGMPVDQTYLDAVQKRIDNQTKNMEMFKTLTLEEKRKFKMDEFSKMAAIQDSMSRVAMQDQTRFKTKLDLMERLDFLVSSNNTYAKEQTTKKFGEAFTKRYSDQDGKFDGESAMRDFTTVQQFTGFNLEKTFGEIKAMDLNIQAARTKNFGLSNNATNLMVEGENKDPQTDAISYLNNKQLEKAVEAMDLTGKAKAAMPFVISNLRMLASRNFDFGNPNTEIATYRVDEADRMLQSSADYISRTIQENPDAVEIVKGDIVFADEDANKAIVEMYQIAEKTKHIPNAQSKILKNVAKIQEDSIQTVIDIKVKHIDEELNSNPIYASLTPAEKAELREEVIKNERTIQMAQGEKERQAEKVMKFAREAGQEFKHNGSGILTATQNLSNLVSRSAETEDRIRAAAYFAVGTEAARQKTSNFIGKVGRKLFGDSLEEKIEVEYDKKLGLPRSQARVIKSIQGKKLTPERASKIYNQILPMQEELEDRELLGEELTGEDLKRYKYYNKFLDTYNKNYSEVSLADMPERTDSAREITERIMDEGQTQSEAETSIAEEKKAEGIKETMYDLTFNNEIGRGRNDSRELHLPSETSGVTIGPGYDLGERSADEIVTDLTSVGIEQEVADRISQGAGLTGQEAENFIDSNDDIEITDEQEKQLFEKIVPVYEDRAVSDYEEFTIEGKPSYEELPEVIKGLLVDYAYNVGVSKFPKFFNALITGNKEEAIAQYKRYTGDKPLGRRNKDTLKVLNSYDFIDLTE